MKKKYILLKDSPELMKGAILEEECNDGNQGFHSITKEHIKFDDQGSTSYSRKVVTESPEWFEEVNLMYLTLEQIKKVKKFLKIK